MAYARCPVCRTNFRYTVEVPRGGPAWLKEVARAAGRGEQATVLCDGCWVPLRVGDVVVVLHSAPLIGSGHGPAKGIVADIGTFDNGAVMYEVDAIEAHEGYIWRHAFRRAQLKAITPDASTTKRLGFPQA